MKFEASSRRRVKPRRISSSADMSGQATTKSGGVPLRAMTCGCEGQPLSSLSIERTGDRTVHEARLLWVVAVRIFGEPARLSIGNQQDQSQAAPHSPITSDLRVHHCFTKLRAPTTDRLLVAACRQGHPCRSCAHEDLWSQGSRHGSTPPACVVGASPKTRAVVLLYWLRKVACFLIFTSITKKQCQISFLLIQHFRFFLFIFGSSRGGAGG